MKDTKIEWATHTFNPWIGCQKVSPACKHCYAEELTNRFRGDFSGTRRLTSDAYWREPLKWNQEAEFNKSVAKRNNVPHERPRVFCASLADVFEDWQGPILDSKSRMVCRNRFDDDNWFSDREPDVDEHAINMNDVRARLFKLIDATPNLDWLLLTKRPENIARMWCSHVNTDGLPPSQLPRSNVWLGTTVENQEQAEKRIPELLKCRDLSPVLFLSCEPLLGPVSLNHYWNYGNFDPFFDVGIDWVIVGGESGKDARPMHPDWARNIRGQCLCADVPFHFKQWGEYRPWANDGGDAGLPGAWISDEGKWFLKNDSMTQPGYFLMAKVGKKAAGRLLDGQEWNEVPK